MDEAMIEHGIQGTIKASFLCWWPLTIREVPSSLGWIRIGVILRFSSLWMPIQMQTIWQEKVYFLVIFHFRLFVLIFNWVFGKQNKSNSVSWQQITTCWQNWHFSYIFGVFVYKDENDQFKNKRLRSVFTKTKQTSEIHWNCWTDNSLQFWRLPIKEW